MKKIIKFITRYFCPRCPCCRKGVLRLDKIHVDIHGETHVYKCDRCGEEFI